MRWSSLIKGKEDTSNVSVMEYKPKQFDLGTPDQALDYLQRKEKGADFVMSDVLRKTTGIEQIEKQSEEQKIEQLVLEKIQVVQEQAYQEGYQLGQDEGFKAAFEKKKSELEFGLQQLNEVLVKVETIKTDMVEQNESHIVSLIYKVAEKIAFDHIQQNPEIVLSVIKKAIETAQAEQDVVVQIAKEQVEFIETMKQSTGRDFEFLKNVKVEPSDKVQAGGCIVETNYGVIDARIDERTSKLWEEISQMLPKVKSSMAG